VEVSPEIAKQRLMKRNNLTEAEVRINRASLLGLAKHRLTDGILQAMKRINAQISPEERRKHATVVIKNDSDEAALTAAVEEVM